MSRAGADPMARDLTVRQIRGMATVTQAQARSSARTRIANPKQKIAVPGNRGVKVVRACTIRRPAEELYRFWRSVENLQTIIQHPVSVTQVSDLESHWSATAPGGAHMEWDAVIINDEPNTLIAWRSKTGADVPNAGTIRFTPAPGDEGTEVRVQLEYQVPGGKVTAWLAKLTGREPEQQVAETLRAFKALMEAGEIPTIEGQPVGEPQRSKLKKGKS